MNATPRKVERVIEPRQVIEGAGVRVSRSLGTRELDHLDPFLLLDHFASEDPNDYKAGFPLHPHRGIETVTYVLRGVVHHKDSLGNSGSIGAGDVQWMTAGRGILHEEMPQERPEGIAGFQLWVNIPAKLKMAPPRYLEVRSERIKEVAAGEGASVRLIAGTVGEVRGPVEGMPADPLYLDVSVPPHGAWRQELPRGHAAFAYLFEGKGKFGGSGDKEGMLVPHPRLVVFGDGDEVRVATMADPVRFLLVSGKPLGEPIARHGPIVMNTRREIEQALRDLEKGTFA